MKTLTFLFFVLSSLLSAEIVELHHFSDIHPYLQEDTLLILDIDDTLLIPKQMLGCDEWFNHRLNERKNNGFSSKEALTLTLAEFEAIRHLTQMDIVEPGTEKILHDLQAQNLTIMGLTTQGLTLSRRTREHLLEQKIDLSLTAPTDEDVYFRNQGLGVLYTHGILFTNGTAKGEALLKFLERIEWHPSHIVFVNDKTSHLKDVEGSLIFHEIPFIGLRYAYSDGKKQAFSYEIASQQMQALTLLNDDLE